MGRGLHVAVIPDGNGRWALARGRPRPAGHRAGLAAIRRLVPAADDLGVAALTIHAFASANFKRPAGEVSHLMGVFGRYFDAVVRPARERGIRVVLLGRRDRLPADVLGAAQAAEDATAGETGMVLRIAIDYSGREAILAAAAGVRFGAPPPEELFTRLLALPGPPVPPVDLLIRTGGDFRLSDFLLFEAADAELLFLEKRWPDFTPEDLREALAEYQRRERRFGGVAAATERP